MSYSITINQQFNSLEITFDSKPSEAIREVLKSFRFRWNPKKSIWYGFAEREELEKALADEKPAKETKAAKKEKKEKTFFFDVKVGDLFYSSWGYEQTNVDFFQVIELVGEKSVRVREVNPRMIKEDAVSGMSSDRTYEYTKELLPASDYSVFIKDQEKGDLKKLKSWNADGKSEPLFKLSSFASAYKYEGQKLYESWYY